METQKGIYSDSAYVAVLCITVNIDIDSFYITKLF